jgi:hypothetical protein
VVFLEQRNILCSKQLALVFVDGQKSKTGTALSAQHRAEYDSIQLRCDNCQLSTLDKGTFNFENRIYL